MSVLIGIKVKNSAIWLPRFLIQLEKLKGNIVRIAVMYGESADASFTILDHWRRTTKFNVEIYAEPYLPPTERLGALTLARVEKEFQKLLKEGNEEYFLKLDCDIVGIPSDLIPRLIDDDLDLVAPYVWIENRDPQTFFDLYVFRKEGCRFHPFKPPGLNSDRPITVDSVGTCWLAKREVMLAGTFSNPHPDIPFCKSLKDQGYQIWADPRINIIHVDLEKYGIFHNPQPGPLSETSFIMFTDEKMQMERVQAEFFHAAKLNYEKWFAENHSADFLAVKHFWNSRPLITASYKVLNEGMFLKYSLRSVYKYVDRIDIVEGAMKSAMFMANLDGSSTDNTVEIIKNFPDPDNKIKLTQGKWESREEMQAKLLETCSSKWMLFIDGDEIIDEKSMRKIRKFCLNNQDGNIVYGRPLGFTTFWHDFHHVAYSLMPRSPWSKFETPHPFLIWRDIPGLNFAVWHWVPVDGFGNVVYQDNRAYRERIKILKDVNVYHFGNAKGRINMLNKLRLPHPRLLVDEGEVDPWLSGEMPPHVFLERFKGRLPKVLMDHPERKKKRIRITQKKPVYKFEVLKY